MNLEIFERLSRITDEEQAILDGRQFIQRELYMDGKGNTINARKLLVAGKLITLRSHTRFIHFPEHTHDYVEVVYMCAGRTNHIVNGCHVPLCKGELLFMNQRVTHEVCRAEEGDVAVNFIVLPEFFNSVLTAIGEDETPLRRFLVECLCSRSSSADYLHFQVSEVIPVQNLIENLLLILLGDAPNKRVQSQMTMALLFLQLMDYTECLDIRKNEQATVFKVLAYVESNYAQGSLADLADNMHYELSNLSREIKNKTGMTYTQLVQERRLTQAAFLLKNTDRNIDDIATTVGYENIGYFHRIFREAYGASPRNYRLQNR